MPNLVSNLTQYNNYQFTFILVNFIIFVIFGLIAIFNKRMTSFIMSLFSITVFIGIIVSAFFFANQQNVAVNNHEYNAIKKQKTLEIESKSDMIKSHKFAIDSEDDTHIYIKTSSLFGTNTYVIEKSELDSVDGN